MAFVSLKKYKRVDAIHVLIGLIESFARHIRQKVRNNMIAVKNIKGFSSAYPNMCDLKLLSNADGNWITIKDDTGIFITIKPSDLSDFIINKGTDKIDVKREKEITNLENLYQLMRNFGGLSLTSEQESFVLLTSIAQSLAVIADRLTGKKEGEE